MGTLVSMSFPGAQKYWSGNKVCKTERYEWRILGNKLSVAECKHWSDYQIIPKRKEREYFDELLRAHSLSGTPTLGLHMRELILSVVQTLLPSFYKL